MNGEMELLAPAGGMEALRAAVENGADAVYLGGKLFNARALAGNFAGDELAEAIRYAHVRGVKIYLTMNTLVSDTEMEEALEFASEAWLSGVDAFIIQDLGLAAALKKAVPDIQLHASTQMTIYNAEGVKALEDMGFKRVVLARELSLDEIRLVNEATTVETEVFVHGALCISYSGQCLMSSLIGGRSGNRGKCAQPCRLPYTLCGSGSYDSKPSYLMSPRDLCLLGELGRLAQAGVRSLKIEGRMKSPEYVATVVRIYRKYIDILYGSPSRDSGSAVKADDRDLHDLLQIFNRGGFSKGYLDGKTGRDMMCYEKPKNWGVYLGKALTSDKSRGTVKLRLEEKLSIGDGIEAWNGEGESPGTVVTSIIKDGSNVRRAEKGDIVTVGNIFGSIPADCRLYKTSDKELNAAAAVTYEGKPLRRVKLNGRASLKAGSPLSLTAWDEDGNEMSASGGIKPEAALSRPVTHERLADQLKKTGSTPFEFKDLTIELEEGLSIPISEINEVRRRVLEELKQKRADTPVRLAGKGGIAAGIRSILSTGMCQIPGKRTVPGISVYFYKMRGDINYASLKADRLYLPLVDFLKPGFEAVSRAYREAGSEVFVWLPSVTRGNYDALIKSKFCEAVPEYIDGLLVGNPGTVETLKHIQDLRLAGDLALNIFNRLALGKAAEMGLESVMLSAELTIGQVGAITGMSPVTVEAAVYGRLPLMTSEYCPAGSTAGGFASGRKCGGSCKSGDYRLKDRLGMEFPVMCDPIDCRSTILNSNVLFIPDDIKRLTGFGTGLLRLYISDEEPDTVEQLVRMHRCALDGAGLGDFGHLADVIRAKGFTKGHYFRGV